MKRATASAWFVFAAMAGTTIAFQVYHSIKYGGMPWPLAVLYGTVPLVIAIGVLDFVSEWEDAPRWVMVIAYAIIAGSMVLSSNSTGDVVHKAAPGHLRLLFGILLDVAAVIAAQYLITRIRKARADNRAAAERAAAGQHEMLLNQDEMHIVQAMRAGVAIGPLPDAPPPDPRQQQQLPNPARRQLPPQPPVAGGGGGRRRRREPMIEALPAPIEARAQVLAAATGRSLTDARIIALVESGTFKPTSAGPRVGKSDRHGRNVWTAWQAQNGQGSPGPAPAGQSPAPETLEAAGNH